MTAPLLSVVAPVVRQSTFGDWLVDDGSLVPQRASDRPAAFDEAAARSLNPPPVGDPKSSAAPCRASSLVATPDGAGSNGPYRTGTGTASNSGQAIPPPPGTVPEPTNSASPGGCGSGTPSFSAGRCEARPSEGSAGAAVVADVAPVADSAVES